jgi:6-phosphogluconolactonase/glucosamine-6-phosphate isomerase/deaminase/alpha-beta hydrolase superfamily lysophospholipase
MVNQLEKIVLPKLIEGETYVAPNTVHLNNQAEFSAAVGIDFIEAANEVTEKGHKFLVGLSHGISPSGPYQYILDHYDEIKHPDLVHYTFVNSKLQRQRGLVDIKDAVAFVKELLRTEKITKDQIIGRSVDRKNLDVYKKGINKILSEYFKTSNKRGLDYVFLASDPNGLVAGIKRESQAFGNHDYVAKVTDTEEPELTFTPHFLMQSQRIAFLATKADKRRALAWLYYKWATPDKSPEFLRFIDDVQSKMTVFVDDRALTWPQIILSRRTNYGSTTIKVDMAEPFSVAQSKKPVVLMIHGFLGLNSFDALLSFSPHEKYIPAALHFGTIPYQLPMAEYSQFVVENIDYVVEYFGKHGHPVYIFDHSMANIYMLMMEEQMPNLNGIKQYLKGRIASNPFFGSEVKFTTINFLDKVILPSRLSFSDRLIFKLSRKAIIAQSKSFNLEMSIRVNKWLVKKDNVITEKIWTEIKKRVIAIVTDLDSLPELNRIPLTHTVMKLPIKLFAIQIQSALNEFKKLDKLERLSNYEKYKIPTLVLKSSIDPIAKFVYKPYEYTENATILDITNYDERDLFKEHLYYLIRPQTTIKVIEQFVEANENNKES